ncbi:MAG TPA: TonB-dependent receptor [Sphingomonas sp.]|nr:TonB-dependent receptor [Sphingomonas sp.]
MKTWIGGLLAAGSAAMGTPAAGQDADRTDGPEQEVVILGTRGQARLASDSPSPVDVFSAADLEGRGLQDLSRALQFLAPSFNYARSATAPSAANTRAASLRGLAPDQVLVLVNGKRWHGSSVINFNNVVGRGSVPVDLNAIPLAAISKVEILRDGAAAQYGSDAIAGVINITLKSGSEAGFASGQSGITSKGDGATRLATLNQGFALGTDGSLNLTAEVRQRDATNRAGIDSRYHRITSEQGDPRSTDASFAGSLRQKIGSAEAYADAVYNHRHSVSPAQYRAPTVSPIYPIGFVPHIRLKLEDLGGIVGLRGQAAGWNWDLSETWGRSTSEFSVADTVNTSLGFTGPTSFEAGGARYIQNVVAITMERSLPLLSGASVAAGAERRGEAYRIRSGDPLSFAGAGAQGFPGFNPPHPVDAHRHAWSFYLDAELKPVSLVTLGMAVRHERYSDFGNATTGKLSLFVKPATIIAVRASASTGFRAPSLQQSYFSTVTGQSVAGVLVNVGTFAVSDPVAQALGAQPLRRERSRNLSAGIVLTPTRHFTLAADLFRVKIRDRIALSETLSGPAVTAVLRNAGITNASQVRFFTNALDTTTEGFEVTANWRGRLASSRIDLNASYTLVNNDTDRRAPNLVLPALPLLGPVSLALLNTAQPKDKLTLGGRIDVGPLGLDATVVRFGHFTAISVLNPQTYGAVTTVDVAADYRVAARLALGLGILNLTNAYPDKIADRALTQGGGLLYPEVGALGTNGREYYVRATWRF